MTQQEALKETQKRWGNIGAAWFLPGLDDLGNCVTECIVGILEEKSHPNFQRLHLRGSGDSWEAAFADADCREKKKGPYDNRRNRAVRP